MQNSSFQLIVSRFISSMYALRIFSSEIGGLAEEHDLKTMRQFTSNLLGVFGIPPEKLGEIDISAEVSKKKKELLENKNFEKEKMRGEFEESMNELTNIAMKDPRTALGFGELLNSFRKKSPMQSHLLRQGALINLLIYFENLFSDLIHHYYFLFPSALPSEDRLLSLSELRETGSIPDAEQLIVDREVDAVLRESTKEQIEYMEKRGKVDIAPLKDYMNDITEISQRRNIFVHNRGMANKIYLSNVSQNLIDLYGVSDGKFVDIEEEYLSGAINTIYLCGIILAEQCWRKWKKEEAKGADSLLASLTYDTLAEERYTLTVKFAEYANKVKFVEDRSRRVVVINHAIALKQMGLLDEMEKLLALFDWSSSALDFQIALSALRNNETELALILPRAISAEIIKKEDLEEWPLFKEFRNSTIFEEIIQRYFP